MDQYTFIDKGFHTFYDSFLKINQQKTALQLQQVCWLDGELLQDWGTVTLTIKIYF
jgi:hypothetical protein